MKIYILTISIFLFSFATFADCRGCCSRHKGVVCISGVTQCKDGASLSAKCQEKQCNRCFGEKNIFKSLGLKKKSLKARVKPKQTYSPFSPKSVQSFSSAKNNLAGIYKGSNQGTVYCGCKFNPLSRVIDHKGCGFKTSTYKNRGKVEYEHVMPKSWYTTKENRTGEGDMHNLYPSVGTLNAVRSNKMYGDIRGEYRAFGKCDFESTKKLVEPQDSIKGNIARTYLYMISKYNVSKDRLKELPNLQKWSMDDPPDTWECKRNKLIQSMQGNDNPFITSLCLINGM